MSAETLDSLRFPLHGPRLIEASAGTGKTFTIAALYVRLVLGHGDADSRFRTPLLPPQILVVTFTNAATRELRDRIRNRLADAARRFRGQIESADPFLEELLAEPEYAGEKDRVTAARQLERAAEWMDEAAVYTIHGWCQRMLVQHAFDTGSLFQQTLEQDDGELLAEMARDYWRTFCFALSADAADALQREVKVTRPDELLNWVRPLLDRPAGTVLLGGEPLTDPQSPADFDRQLQAWMPDYTTLLDRARELWRTNRETLEATLWQAVQRKDLNNASYNPKYLADKLERMAAWADGDGNSGAEPKKFASDVLASKTSKKGTTPEHPVFDALQALVKYEATRPFLQGVRLHAARWIESRFEHSQLRAARMGFNDMLKRLDEALDSEGGERLARVIREQYPVAMIDEFQDTDPVQYRIFRRIYGMAETGDCALLMIGDPKQAIYAFRGADIHTYLQARRDIHGRHYTLGKNFRSTAPLVAATNRLFGHAERQHPEEGAFLFGQAGDNPLPFLPVEARGREEWLEVEADRPPAMTAWLLEADEETEGVGVRAYRDLMAEHCAAEIARLLNLAAAERAGFRSDGGDFTPLRPADIAVLVRSGQEAELVRAALDRRRVRSVYLSDRESVCDSPEALDLWRWLRACAEPEQVRYVQGALATATLGLGYEHLATLHQDERLLEDEVGFFRELRHCWQRQGILATVRRLLDHFQLPAQLLKRPGGERALTNLLHLAELLQSASARVEGELALIRFLQEQIAGADRGAEEQVVRLESDADLVQVVTIHKAKGLQYPLVFLPFPCTARTVSARDGTYHYQDPGTGNVVELDKEQKSAKEAAERERLQEDLRLLYVALTRPMHACWLGLAAVFNNKSPFLHKSAMGQLLGATGRTSTEQLRELLAPVSGDDIFAVVEPPPPASTTLDLPQDGEALRPAAHCREPVARDHWWIASYSALHRFAAPDTGAERDLPEAAVPDSAREDIALEAREAPSSRGFSTEGHSVHHFPRGAAAGTFLHGLLEWAADEGFDRVVADADLRRSFLEPRCQAGPWRGWADVLDAWLRDLLATPLPLAPRATALEALTTRQAEMEFWFAVGPADVAAIDRLACRAVAPDEPRPALAPQRLGGMMKGFVDLVFEHEGRYWVADYKSNWLGASDASYSPDTMLAAVLEKRYDVQYLIYLVALHRLLKARLPGYAEDPVAGYEAYVGGALYLFLRGIGEPEHRGCFLDRPPARLITTLDELLSHGEEGHD